MRRNSRFPSVNGRSIVSSTSDWMLFTIRVWPHAVIVNPVRSCVRNRVLPYAPSVVPSPAIVENSALLHALETTRFPYERTRPYPRVSIVYQWKCVALSRGSLKEFSRFMMYSAYAPDASLDTRTVSQSPLICTETQGPRPWYPPTSSSPPTVFAQCDSVPSCDWKRLRGRRGGAP